MRILHDSKDAERLLRREPLRHLLALGDLDPAFWDSTICYEGNGQMLFVYCALSSPVVLAHADNPRDSMPELVRECQHLLPPRFYLQATSEAASALEDAYDLRLHGTMYQMALGGRPQLVSYDEVEFLDEADLYELIDFYSDIAFTDQSRFEAGMLAAGPYVGIRLEGKIVSVAGTLVHSDKTRVAVLGNIAAKSKYRRRGFASATTSALCAEVQGRDQSIDIGLNVAASNTPAIACYKRLGFDVVGEFKAYTAVAREKSDSFSSDSQR